MYVVIGFIFVAISTGISMLWDGEEAPLKRSLLIWVYSMITMTYGYWLGGGFK